LWHERIADPTSVTVGDQEKLCGKKGAGRPLHWEVPAWRFPEALQEISPPRIRTARTAAAIIWIAHTKPTYANLNYTALVNAVFET